MARNVLALAALLGLALATGCGLQPILYDVHPTRELKLEETTKAEFTEVGKLDSLDLAVFVVGYPAVRPSLLDIANRAIDDARGDRITNFHYETSEFNLAYIVDIVFLRSRGTILRFKE